MPDVSSRISKLSPEKLAILSSRLKECARMHSFIPHRENRHLPAPLSFAQERLWFLHQVDPGNPAYHIVGAVELSGELDAASLQCAVTEIARRHEALRTTFISLDGKPFQVVSPTVSLKVESSPLDSAASLSTDKWIGRNMERPFDLVHGPLLRVSLGRISKEKHIFLSVMHHIAGDAPSMNLYFQELIEIYSTLREQRSHELAELPVQYADFSAWQRDVLTEAVLSEEISYWNKQLQGIGELPVLPVDHPQARNTNVELASESIQLQAALVDTFKTLLAWQQATPFVGFLAAFEIVLHYLTGFTDIVIGSPFTGRTRVELERVIGLFANLQVLRADLRGDPVFLEILKRVSRVVSEAQDHQQMPFQRLVEELQPARTLGQIPLFQTSFTFLIDFAEIPEIAGLRVTPLNPIHAIAMYDLDLNLIQRCGTLMAVFEYKKVLFDAGTISALLAAFHLVLTEVSSNPELRLSQLVDLLSKAERDRASSKATMRVGRLRENFGRPEGKLSELQIRNGAIYE
jgi:hypothetical protein